MKGQDPHGRPKLRYRDQLKCSLKQACINLQSWEQLANDRAAWRRKIRDGVESFETARKQKDEDRRKRGHEKNNKPRPLPLYCTMWPLPTPIPSQVGPSKSHPPLSSTTDGKVLIAHKFSARTQAGADNDDEISQPNFVWWTTVACNQILKLWLGQVFVAVKKWVSCIYFQRKLHLCAHLTAKDLTQPIFVCMDLAKSQDFPLFHLWLSSGTVVLGWGCKTSTLQTNETQLIRHIALFHAIKENRTKLK